VSSGWSSGADVLDPSLATAPATILLDDSDPNLTQIHFVPRLVSGAP
jgi:hypothetical protein